MMRGADAIAARAMAQIGTPFKLHGRTPGTALDCAGLAAYAVHSGEGDFPAISRGYQLKGDFLAQIKSYLEQMGFESLPQSAEMQPGDVVLVRPGARQLHVMIKSGPGFVHAHAGLRRVVITPGPSPWPVVAAWRISGV